MRFEEGSEEDQKLTEIKNLTSAELRRRYLDSDEPFMSGGHQILKARKNIPRKYKTPEWMLIATDRRARIRELLEREFPKWETSKSQQKGMMVWFLVINMYFIMYQPAQAVVDEVDFFRRDPARDKFWEWGSITVKSVEHAIRRIRNVLGGLRTDGRPHTGRAVGRPPKNDGIIRVRRKRKREMTPAEVQLLLNSMLRPKKNNC